LGFGPTTGGASIRTRVLLAAVAIILASPLLLFAADPIVLLFERDRREVLPVLRNGVEMVPLAQVLSGQGVTMSPDMRASSLVLSYGGREVTVYDRKSLASVGGDLRLLSSPVLLEEGRWLAPLDSLPRLLQPLLGKKVDWRAASRLLVVGDVGAPRVSVTTFVSGDAVRIVLEASEKVPFRVEQDERRVTVSIARELVETPPRQERLTGGIVDSVQFVGGRDNVFAIGLGRRFQNLKTSEEDNRLVLEFQARPLTAAAPPASTPAPGAPVEQAPPVGRAAPAEPRAGGLRTVVIDPGHGGEEVGAMGPGGAMEKDVTLNIARKLRGALVNGLGVQAFLTRDRDMEVPLDERAAFANNYKADLFISIHANASRSHGAKGSEVYFLSYQSTDEESRRLAASEGAIDMSSGAGVAAGSDLALILWDMAQAEHLEASSALATRIQEELAVVTGSEGRGIKQAPFRVLVGAAMPAVLLEVAFISNSEEEKLLVSDAYQNKIVGAVVRGVARYQQQRASVAGSGSVGPGRQ
jgi:N-acetylmuramoyl-L-alanine amidase